MAADVPKWIHIGGLLGGVGTMVTAIVAVIILLDGDDPSPATTAPPPTDVTASTGSTSTPTVPPTRVTTGVPADTGAADTSVAAGGLAAVVLQPSEAPKITKLVDQYSGPQSGQHIAGNEGWEALQENGLEEAYTNMFSSLETFGQPDPPGDPEIYLVSFAMRFADEAGAAAQRDWFRDRWETDESTRDGLFHDPGELGEEAYVFEAVRTFDGDPRFGMTMADGTLLHLLSAHGDLTLAEFRVLAETVAAHPFVPAEADAAEPGGDATGEYAGTWSGATSQGFPMTITVTGATVVDAKFKISLDAATYSVTVDFVQPVAVGAAIVAGSFTGEVVQSDARYVIEGRFTGGSLTGTISGSKEHPDGLGTAAARVDFDLSG